MNIVRLTWSNLSYHIIHPLSMVQYFDCRFCDSFIAKREMPGTNGEEENIKNYSIYRCYKWRAGGLWTNYE